MGSSWNGRQLCNCSLSFLSGTFYSITVLPGPIQTASLINPFFYMIDGFRYGFLGVSDSSYLSAIFILLVIFIFFRDKLFDVKIRL